MAGNSRIWRDSNTVPVSDIIEFNEGAIPDNTTHIQQTNITLVSAVGVNEKPKAQLDEIQDTGFASLTFIITGFIEDPTSSGTPDIVKGWMLDDKTNSSFPFGRFGLQLDDFPDYNVRPNSNRGLILSEWNWVRDGETRGKSNFVATLRFNAVPAGLNSPTYNWDSV